MLTKTFLAVVLLMCASASSAAAGPWGNVNCGQQPTAACDLAAGTSPVNEGRPGSSAGTPDTPGHADDELSSCRYKPVDNPAGPPHPEGSGDWFMVLCSPDGKDPLSHGPVWIPAGETTPVRVEDLAETARSRLVLPAPGIAASPARTQLVHLPTWLWLAQGWQAMSATASAPGVTVTADAAPTSVTWSMGDGVTITCNGAGTPFRPGSDAASSSPDCGHTYRISSAQQAGQEFPVIATTHWAVTWSGAGQSGTFLEMTTTGNAAFRVAESQAITTG